MAYKNIHVQVSSTKFSKLVFIHLGKRGTVYLKKNLAQELKGAGLNWRAQMKPFEAIRSDHHKRAANNIDTHAC